MVAGTEANVQRNAKYYMDRAPIAPTRVPVENIFKCIVPIKGLVIMYIWEEKARLPGRSVI